MALHSYKCDACGNNYVLRESYDAPDSHACPRCGAAVRRVVVAPNVLLRWQRGEGADWAGKE